MGLTVGYHFIYYIKYFPEKGNKCNNSTIGCMASYRLWQEAHFCLRLVGHPNNPKPHCIDAESTFLLQLLYFLSLNFVF